MTTKRTTLHIRALFGKIYHKAKFGSAIDQYRYAMLVHHSDFEEGFEWMSLAAKYFEPAKRKIADWEKRL